MQLLELCLRELLINYDQRRTYLKKCGVSSIPDNDLYNFFPIYCDPNLNFYGGSAPLTMMNDDYDVEQEMLRLKNSLYSQDNKVPRRIASSESCSALYISWLATNFEGCDVESIFYK